jgi:hypothetical protein
MRLSVIVAVILTACGGQGSSPSDLAAAFEAAGAPLAERELNDGRTAWSSDTDEDVVVELIEDEDGSAVEEAFVFVPALRGDAADYPGARYVAVLDEHLAPGLTDWIAEEAAGRSSGGWSATREFGSWTAEIENDPDTLGSFTVSLKQEQD